ncbi:MAG: ribonuclease P protein component [Bacteroidetes bacterium]|nr:MAG: ribonuclease P protein component [Bacteroidota bacterium]
MFRLTFKKKERLTSKKTFDLLFNSGRSFTVAPFRLVWMDLSHNSPSALPTFAFRSATQREGGKGQGTPAPVQLGISVTKRSFPKAVYRNTLKRRIREAYRKNKHLLYEVLHKKNLSIALMVIYIGKEESHYQEIEKKMIVSLRMLTERM